MNNEKHKLKNLKFQIINKEETRKPKVKNLKLTMEIIKERKLKMKNHKSDVKFVFILLKVKKSLKK